jgi:alkylation response protein AidB-like acyl-CoA dehydrogenase
MAGDLVSSRYLYKHFRLIVRKAAELVDKNDSNKTVYSAMAKKIATELCSNVCDYSLQMHGGYGYLRDYGIEKYVRDLRVHQILEGTN